MTLLIVLIIILPFGIAAVIGAPYVPILRRDAHGLFELANLMPGQTLIDLGSGDGRFLRAAAKQGIRGIGYEINPLMFAISLIVTWRYRHLVKIYLADFWSVTLPPADCIYVFLIERLMPKLNQRLKNQISQPTQVISHVFAIPGQKPVKTTRSAFKYLYGA